MSIQDRRNQLLASANCDANLRVLLGQGFLKFLANDQATIKFLEMAFADGLEEHLNDRCRCDLTDGGLGCCYIAEWYEGCREGWELITEMGQEGFAYYFEKYVKLA